VCVCVCVCVCVFVLSFFFLCAFVLFCLCQFVLSLHFIWVFAETVDLYNTVTGTWSTAQLSAARGYLAATSVGNVAFFAGGYYGPSGFLLLEMKLWEY
jgi:hypothetical protein